LKNINYRHLHVFWAVATRGGISAASDVLGVTAQTISEQIRILETTLGSSLFTREGRGLTLTEQGRLVLGYADEMFAIGQQLQEALSDESTETPLRLRVGVANAMPKTIAYHILEPALRMDRPVRVVCREADLDDLLGDLAAHRLELVLADRPMPPSAAVRGFNHLLGESGMSFFGSPGLVARFSAPFPACLDGAPLLVQAEGAVIRGRLMRWFADQGVRPRIVGEFDDGALMKAFGQASAGFFASPTAIADEVVRQYGVMKIGEASDVREQFYAISIQRRLTHPVVVAIAERARTDLFRPEDLTQTATPDHLPMEV